MKMYLLLLLLVPCGLQAEIYRSVDNYGNVTFTDEPNAQAERIELEEITTYEPLPIDDVSVDENAESDNENDNEQIPNYIISITSPVQNQSIWGSLTASVSVEPNLDSQQHGVQFILDGKRVGAPQTGLSYTFETIERGSHILAVAVVDKAGNVLSTSKSVLFQTHRPSVLINRNAGRP